MLFSMHQARAIVTKKFKESHQASVAGQIVSDVSGKSRLSCTSRCLQQDSCFGILYGKHLQDVSQRCKLIQNPTDCLDVVNITTWSQYTYYMKLDSNKKPCTDLGIGVATPSDWNTDCPTLYFKLDTAIPGGKRGEDASNIQFVTNGKVGNALKNPAPDSDTESWYQLGSYTNPDHCFQDPQECVDGMSVAFWLKLINTGSASHGIMSTTTQNSPGFNMVGTIHYFI